MRTLMNLLFISMICLCSSGCHASMTGKVVDAETGKPIEGAVLLVEWLKSHGIGLTSHTSAKAVEVFSDKDGIVNIPGYANPFVEGPFITIYKPGYVAWNNKWIFPDARKRTDLELINNYNYRLEKFKEGYSYVEHDGFVNFCINHSLTKKNKDIFLEIFDTAEKDKSIAERRAKTHGIKNEK